MDLPDHGGDTIVTTGSPVASSTGGWTPRLALSFISMVLVLEMLSCSYLMISVALQDISSHFQTTQGVWMLTAFLLLGAVSSPLVGKLADTHGKRKLLLACVMLSASGALISALAPTFPILVVGWALTGFLNPCLFLTYALIRDVYPPRTVVMAVSISTTGMGLIAVPAPFFTGWIIDNFGFRGVFWFFVLSLSALTVIIRVTTEESPIRLRSRIDIVGAVLLGTGLGGLLVCVSFGPDWGWAAPSTLAVLAGGALFMIAWLVSARTLRDPLIDLEILSQRPIALTSASSGLAWAAIAAFVMLLPIVVMTPGGLGLGYGFGADAGEFAWFNAPVGAMTLVGGFIVGAFVTRVPPKQMMVAGLLVVAMGSVLLALSHDSKGLIMLFAGLVGLGGGMAYAATPNLLIEAVPPQLLATSGAIASTAGNVLPAVLPVLVFAMLNSHIAFVVDGSALYSNVGISIGFAMIAGAALLGALAATAIPRSIRRPDAPPIVVTD
ncbi:MFS transporter [Prescottella equi]|uniref:MFS transporter n=1 Tax=Rhodococcus hoagii TaxID=43767 RepID=UPI0009BF6EEE|nr:MFS transporter [Prescottella equi]MBM4733862.1 MFS transporter [Prescottella equi]OQQ25173.1 MFS transporter [Prescottella equi]